MRVIGSLDADFDVILRQVSGLEGRDLEEMTKAVAQVRHLERHLRELVTYLDGKGISDEGWKQKQAAALTAANRARKLLIPLARRAGQLVK